ncbi:MAG: AI-2E family transporter [Candidatus Pacearchaeota archaeon]|jgi:predicted PurR-regulated permease PerM
MNENTTKYIIAALLIGLLLVFTVLVIKPIFLSILLGLILAYVFFPVNKWITSKVKQETVSALITCLIVLGLLLVFIWLALPLLISQIFDFYTKVQSFDTIGLLKKVFPPLFNSAKTSVVIQNAYSNLLTTITKSTIDRLTNTILDLPGLIINFLVVLITFFYALRDGEKLINLMRDTLPFDKLTINKFIHKSKRVTTSVVFGRLIIGIITGALAGIGFYIVGVDNVLLLTVFAMVISILPIIGPWIIWLPVCGALFLAGNTTGAIFLFVYSLVVVTLFESLAHPIYISKQSEIPNSLTMIGLLGGLIAFGLFGIIIGPLIVAYLLILFDLYKESNAKKIQEKK